MDDDFSHANINSGILMPTFGLGDGALVGIVKMRCCAKCECDETGSGDCLANGNADENFVGTG